MSRFDKKPIHGWNIVQSHFLGQDLRDAWLAH
jgi:hypothetical protein